MIFVTFTELRSHLELDNLGKGVELIKEAFNLLNNHERHHYLFTNIDEYQEKAAEYATNQGWDLETTVVLFEPPPTEEEKEKIAEERAIEDAKAQAKNPDWEGDCTVGSVDPKQVICSFYQNCTLKKMADTINSMGRLKAFL